MPQDSPQPADSTAAFVAEHAAWHAEVEAGRTAPHGPLSITALHWATELPQRFPDLPGVWSAAPDGTVTVILDAADGVTRDGAETGAGDAASDDAGTDEGASALPLAGTVTLGPLTGVDAEWLEWGDRRIQVAARSGRIAIRPHDPASPLRRDYTGTETYPASPDWVIRARFEPAPRTAVEVASAVPGGMQFYDSPGVAAFEIAGEPVFLTLFGDGGSLRAHFSDASGADTSFAPVRFVPVRRVAPDADGADLEIDFNRAVNPPFAYTDHATCPFPPPENRLGVRVDAGERRYRD